MLKNVVVSAMSYATLKQHSPQYNFNLIFGLSLVKLQK